MKNKKKVFLIFITILVLLFGGCEKEKKEKELYTCPMHPQIIKDKMGSCPICGMDLVKMEKEKGDEQKSTSNKEAHSTGWDPSSKDLNREEIYISPYQQQIINIRISDVKKRKLEKVIYAPGIVTYDPELYTAQLEYISIYKNSKNSKYEEIREKLLESAKLKLFSLGLSLEQIRELENKEKPDQGFIGDIESSEIIVYADVSQNDLSYIKIKDEVEITTQAYKNKIYKGNVISIDTVLNAETKNARIRIKTQNSQKELLPEMYVNVKIKSFFGEFLSVPYEAVMPTGNHNIVFVDKGDGHFEPRNVILGKKVDEYYIVKSGLYENERVVINGNFLIDSESQLKAAFKNLMDKSNH